MGLPPFLNKYPFDVFIAAANKNKGNNRVVALAHPCKNELIKNMAKEGSGI